MRRAMSATAVILMAVSFSYAQSAPAGKADAPPAAASRIVSVTVFQASALVGREVVVPQGLGAMELVVPALPPSIIPTSLYAEGTAGAQVLTTRYRSRPLAQVSQEELRKLDTQLRELKKAEAMLTRQVETANSNLRFLDKLEGFTGATMQQLTDKGMLSAEAVTKLSQFVMDTRGLKSTEMVSLTQQIQAGKEQQEFLNREIQKLSGSSDKTSREAIVVVDKADAAAGKVTLYYLVSAAAWRPQYKVHATAGQKQVEVEYLAAIHQQTGEDWTGVNLVLSTAMPMFNAAPPELSAMEVQPVAGPKTAAGSGQDKQQMNVNVDGNRSGLADNVGQQSRLRGEALQFAQSGDKAKADRAYNEAAALQQAEEIMQVEDSRDARLRPAAREGQSVTFHLERKMSIPWRDDEQTIEVARVPLEADFFYKAVPVLTQHVYRLANLTNNSKLVILPGEATMYVGSDFVGRASMPLVAMGQTFTAGFGVDPQIQVKRDMVAKTRTTQGGNQVQKFDYRITLANYKSEPARVELWDRMPYAEGEAVTITMANSAPQLSKDETYVRDQQPKGLLRWDLTLEPNTSGTKATSVTYQYKMEYAKDSSIGNIFNR